MVLLERCLNRGFDGFAFQRDRQLRDRAQPQIVPEDFADERRIFRNDLELLADASVAKGNRSPDPEALAFGGGDLIPDAFPDHLPCELAKSASDRVRRSTL
jgi:hypothetical protein